MTDVENLPAEPDLSALTRENMLGLSQLRGSLDGGAAHYWARCIADQIAGPETHPSHLPWEVILDIGTDPVVNLGELIAIGPALDANVYHFEDGRADVVAEHEAWLWPLLPRLLEMILRAVAWGVVPLVLTWKRGLRHVKDGQVVSRPGLLHYSDVDDLFPGDVEYQKDERGKVRAIHYGGEEYLRDRATLALWRDQWGWLVGQGSRRRNFKPWLTKRLVRLWRGRYLERSVDPVRIGWAPSGSQKDENGQAFSPVRFVQDLLMMLKNGAPIVFPNTRMKDTQGNPTNEKAYEIDKMELDERETVFESALTYEDGEILLGCMVPPATVLPDGEGLAAVRVPAEAFVELVEMSARFAAAVVSELVAVVHAYNRGPEDPAPIFRARDIPKVKRKLLLSVFQRIADTSMRIGEDKVVSPAELVDAVGLLDQLGVPRRLLEEAVRKLTSPAPEGGREPGRPQDPSGEREERRENATTDEGEDATGAPGEEPAEAEDE